MENKVIPFSRNRVFSQRGDCFLFALQEGHCPSTWSNVGATIHDGRKQALAMDGKVSDEASSQVTREIVEGLGDVLCTKHKLQDMIGWSSPGAWKEILQGD